MTEKPGLRFDSFSAKHLASTFCREFLKQRRLILPGHFEMAFSACNRPAFFLRQIFPTLRNESIATISDSFSEWIQAGFFADMPRDFASAVCRGPLGASDSSIAVAVVVSRLVLDFGRISDFIHAMYYHVEGTNLRLLGAMHTFPVENKNMPSWVWDAFNWCDDLFFEAQSPESCADWQTVARLPAGKTIQQLASPKLWIKLKRAVPQQIQALNIYKPWWVFFGVESVLNPSFDGVEKQFYQRLKTNPKPLAFLETPRICAPALEEVPYRDYLTMLEFALDNQVALKKSLFDIYDAWIRCRIDDFHSCVARDPLVAFPAYRQGMVIARNKNWIPSFKLAFPSARKILFSVGAMHIFGDGGLEHFFAKEKHPLIPLQPWL